MARPREEIESHQTEIFSVESHSISCKRRMPSFARYRGPGALLGPLLVKKGHGMSKIDDSPPVERLETFHADHIYVSACSPYFPRRDRLRTLATSAQTRKEKSESDPAEAAQLAG